MADQSFSLASRIKLNNGLTMPRIHLGVYLMSGNESSKAVTYALDAGYRAVDSAQMYHNERDVGNSILNYLKSHPELKREDIHYTTKLASNSDYDRARQSITKSVKECGLGYIDLFLLHSPYGGRKARLESWKAVEDAIMDGEVKIGGVSNFGPQHVCIRTRIVAAASDALSLLVDRRATVLQPSDQAGGQPDRGSPVQHANKHHLTLSKERYCGRSLRASG